MLIKQMACLVFGAKNGTASNEIIAWHFLAQISLHATLGGRTCRSQNVSQMAECLRDELGSRRSSIILEYASDTVRAVMCSI